jgi:hypothetical protein
MTRIRSGKTKELKRLHNVSCWVLTWILESKKQIDGKEAKSCIERRDFSSECMFATCLKHIHTF